MNPILFPPTATSFGTNGLGRLSDAISCRVSEARNGAFELTMVYPLNGIHFKDIVKAGIIYAKPSARRDPQAFTIDKISRPINGRVTITARHLRNRMALIPVAPFSAGSLAGALAGFKTNAAEACPFTLTADFTSSSSYAVPVPTPILSYLGGQQGSVLDVYGGEWEFDNWTAILHKTRGQDNGYRIMYGKNLVDLKQEENIMNTYTGIFPYWQSEETMVMLPEKVMHSAAAASWPFQRTVVKDFTEDFVNAPSVEQLRAFTEAFMARNDIGKPSVSLSVKWVNAADTPEYKQLLTSNVDLCDTVEVIFTALGVSTKAKIIEYEWDVLQERYESLEIGDKRETLALTIEEQMKTISTLPTMSQMHTAVDRATGVLNSGTRGHMIANRNAEGWANELLFLDNENLAAARQILRINMAGIGFSDSGIAGPYSQSWDLFGHLTLGGINNSYGDFTILDENAVPVLQMDKRGFFLWNISAKGYLSNGVMYTDASLTTPITPTEGYYYYDVIQRAVYLWDGTAYTAQTGTGGIYARMTREDGLGVYHGTIDFSWGENSVGFFADGTKVQIGDFVCDSASYGRGIFQSVDEKTGMSADTGDEDLLYLWAGYNDSDDYVFVVNGADAYVMKNGVALPIWESLNNLNNVVSAYASGGDGDDDDEGDETSTGSASVEEGFTANGEVYNDLEPEP